MRAARLLAIVVVAVALAACSSSRTRTYQKTLESPPSATGAAAPEAGATWTSTYPYGTAQPAGAAPAPAPAAAPAASVTAPTPAAAVAPAPTPAAAAAPAPSPPPDIRPGEKFAVPGVGEWQKPSVSEEKRRADIESCYHYAWAQVDHDIRIDSDREAAREDDQGLGFTQLTRRMDVYDHQQRRTSLFNACMKSQGYDRG